MKQGMNHAYFRFYEELNDFLPQARRKIRFVYNFAGNPSIKDAIEAIGVPHPEIDLILVNSKPVQFSYKLKDEDEVSVYPVFETLDITTVTHLREKPLRDMKFICDAHLGKLVKLLRLCGFDSLCDAELDDADIIELALQDKRIILTRDKQLLKNKKVSHGYWIRSTESYEQLKEVLLKFDLKRKTTPFTRCMECNGEIHQVSKSDILDKLETNTRRYYRKFMECPDCGRLYWNGSHYNNMKKRLKTILHQLKS
jgi:uncharacterized protein with PIN domain